MKEDNTKQDTTPITSVTPDHLELIKAYLEYQELKKQQIVRKNPRYKIRIELDVVSSNSEEYSDEDDADDEESDFSNEEFEEIEKIVRIKKCFSKLKV
jgi:hypothetical protein